MKRARLKLKDGSTLEPQVADDGIFRLVQHYPGWHTIRLLTSGSKARTLAKWILENVPEGSTTEPSDKLRRR